MHLHGHHVLVLSRDGVPATGSPWWTDTLNVRPGESYVVAFRADNPGIWMDHCHNLPHAAEGPHDARRLRRRDARRSWSAPTHHNDAGVATRAQVAAAAPAFRARQSCHSSHDDPPAESRR